MNSFISLVLIVGSIGAVSLTCGLLGYQYAKHAMEKTKHEKAATFRDLVKDNAPKDSNDVDYPY